MTQPLNGLLLVKENRDAQLVTGGDSRNCTLDGRPIVSVGEKVWFELPRISG